MLSEETDEWFSWMITPPATAAFLGASYWAACVLFWRTVASGDPARALVALVPAASIAVLLGIATILHEDRFHDDLFGWFWKVAYLLVPAAIALAVAQQPRALVASPAARAPLPPGLRLVLAFQGLAMLALGAYLFLAPQDADALWPWDLTPLTARAVGAFVAGFGASALHAVLANDLVRFDGAALAYATLGALALLAVALHAGDLTGADTDTGLYVAFLASVMLTGLFGWWRAREVSA